MKQIFDYLQVSFWAITYLLMIYYSKKNGIMCVAPFSAAGNCAWEFVALVFSFIDDTLDMLTVVYLVFFIMDLLIFISAKHQKKKEREFYVLFLTIWCFVFLIAFSQGNKLVSCFILDLLMQAEWLRYVYIKKLPFNKGMTYVGVLKLLGDLFAWKAYNYHVIPNSIGPFVLVINMIFVAYVTAEYYRKKPNRSSVHARQ